MLHPTPSLPLSPLTRAGGLAVVVAARADYLAENAELTTAERADVAIACAALARVKRSLVDRLEAADAEAAVSA